MEDTGECSRQQQPAKTSPRMWRRTAVKIEPRTTSTGVEPTVLQAALNGQCRRIPTIFDHVSQWVPFLGFAICQLFILQGTIGKLSFISMERKGRDLYQLKKERRDGKFTLGTAVRTAIMALDVSLMLGLFWNSLTIPKYFPGTQGTARNLRLHFAWCQTGQLRHWPSRYWGCAKCLHDRFWTMQALQGHGKSGKAGIQILFWYKIAFQF